MVACCRLFHISKHATMHNSVTMIGQLKGKSHCLTGTKTH